MNTIILYKVVYVDNLGIIEEEDFSSESDARTFAATIPDSVIYKYAILGQIERLT